MFNFHSVTLKLGRPEFEFLCPPQAIYFFHVQFFSAVKWALMYLISQGSVKKRDLILALSRRKEFNGEH